MKHSKFSLADWLTVLGAVGIGFFCFLSLNFRSMGATIQSIIYAAVFALLLGGFAFIVKLLKKTSKNFKTRIIWEWILLFLFVVFAFLGILPFSHYFAVLNQKTEIQNKLTVTIDQAEGMFADYEKYASNRESIYKSRLNSVVSAKNIRPGEYSQYGFVDGTPDNEQVDNKLFILHAQLFPSNYDGENGIKQVAKKWLDDAKNTLENKWAFTFGVVKIVNNVQIFITDWKSNLIQFSNFRAQGETADNFDYPLTFDDVTHKISDWGSPTPLTMACAIGFYVLMLLSYFVSKRHSKFPGLKNVFGIGKKTEHSKRTIITK